MTDSQVFTTFVSDNSNIASRVLELCLGEQIYVKDSETIVKTGDTWKYNGLQVICVDYTPKKWWQFWKKEKQLGFIVEVRDVWSKGLIDEMENEDNGRYDCAVEGE